MADCVPVEEERKQAFPADSASLSRPPLLNSQQDSPNKLFTRVQHNGLFARPPNKPSYSTIHCRLPCSAPIGRRDLLVPCCCVVCAVLIESQSKRLRASGTTRPVQGQLNEDTQVKLADRASGLVAPHRRSPNCAAAIASQEAGVTRRSPRRRRAPGQLVCEHNAAAEKMRSVAKR